jgi:sialate O-acetylesterase
MELPASWQNRGLDFSGVLWFRKELELPAGWHGKELRLAIGATDKGDVTYFNNVQVGSITMDDRQDSWCLLRTYAIPANLVKTGKNVIAVRVRSDKYDGGMIGPAEAMHLSCPALPESSSIPLTGVWQYAVENNYGKIVIPAIPPGPDNPNSPSVLFNGMISPLIPFAIRGAIWYQGESNADRAVQYRTLFPAMIQDWRTQWNQCEFPFMFVQLANFRTQAVTPVESSWAELREAQTMTLRLPDTGMAVAIDIGEALDIHPQNKQDVGLRLALNALAQTYRQQVSYSGPMFKNMTRTGKTLELHFDHVNGGLECRGEKLLGFTIAGADRKFVWADAKISGDTVIVSSPEIAEPEFVRYAWADNPACNLYNTAGLPAVPFRSDMPEQ